MNLCPKGLHDMDVTGRYTTDGGRRGQCRLCHLERQRLKGQWTAKHRRVCKRGHELTPENTFPVSIPSKFGGENVYRRCRICATDSARLAFMANKLRSQQRCPACSALRVVGRHKTRKGETIEFRYCKRCYQAKVHRGPIPPASLDRHNEAVDKILELTARMEHGMPWERQSLQQSVTFWQRKINNTPQTATP